MAMHNLENFVLALIRKMIYILYPENENARIIKTDQRLELAALQDLVHGYIEIVGRARESIFLANEEGTLLAHLHQNKHFPHIIGPVVQLTEKNHNFVGFPDDVDLSLLMKIPPQQ